MAKVAEASQITMGRPSKYPWETWFDGQSWRLELGVDMKVASFKSMEDIIRRNAKRRGVRVTLKVRRSSSDENFETGFMFVQAIIPLKKHKN